MLELISPNGLLPADDPLKRLPDPHFDPVEELVADLPRLLAAKKLRKKLERLPILDVTKLRGAGTRSCNAALFVPNAWRCVAKLGN